MSEDSHLLDLNEIGITLPIFLSFFDGGSSKDESWEAELKSY